MKNFNTSVRSRAALFAALVASTAPAAYAQVPATQAAPNAEDDVGAEAPGGDQDIVVTALRRSERLQSAPAAISVVSADTAKAAGVVSIADVSKLVPSLRFEGGIRPGVPSISLRGIAAIQGGEAPVSILVDGVQIPFLSLARMDLLDITSVEILKGPQGALYGRGAIAGAIVVNTRQPDDEMRVVGRAIAQQGEDYQGVASISGPLVADLLYAKLTGSYQNRRGLLKNVTSGGYDDFIDQGTIEGEIVLTPTNGTRIQLSGMYTKGRNGTNNLALVTTPQLNDFSIQLRQNRQNYDQRSLYRTSLKIDQETPIGTLTVVAQHARAKDFVFNDIDYTSSPNRINNNPQLETASNIDVRMTSNEGRFRWIIGGFYQHRDSENDVNITTDPVAGPATTLQLNYQHNTSKAFGVFAHSTYDLGGGVSAIAAIRYDSDKRFDELRNLAGFGISGTFDAWQPSATLKWQATPDVMAYATYGRGFRSGGFNPGTINFGATGAVRTFKKEISSNYEVGFKAQFADRRVTLNGSFFRTDYDNTQFQRTIITPITARFITSIAKARVNGAEVDLTIRPFPNLSFGASYSLTDSRIQDFNGTTLYVGNELPNAYHDGQQINAEFTPQFNETYTGLFRIDATRRGRIAYDLPNAVTFQPFTIVNVRVGVKTDRWSIAAFASNILDKRAPEFVFPNFFGSVHGRLANQPFRAGVELNFEFGG